MAWFKVYTTAQRVLPHPVPLLGLQETILNTIRLAASRSSLSDLQPMGCMWPRMALNVAQHKFINFLKTLENFVIF